MKPGLVHLSRQGSEIFSAVICQQKDGNGLFDYEWEISQYLQPNCSVVTLFY